MGASRLRGTRELATVRTPRTFAFTASDGHVAFTVTLDGERYSAAQMGRILRYLERALLDPVDPPLKLVAGDPRPQPPAIAQARQLIRAAFDEDPYG